MNRRPMAGLLWWRRRRKEPDAVSPETPPETPPEASPGTPPETPPATIAEAPLTAEQPPGPRQEMLRRLDAWLSETLADEPPPPGLDAGILAALNPEAAPGTPAADPPSADRVSLCAALTALTHEVGLQGRAFRQLDESLSPLADWGDRVARVEQAQRQLADSLAETTAELSRKAAEANRAGRLAAERVLLDLYDRLRRGLDSCYGALRRQPPPAARGLWARILRRDADPGNGQAAVEALAEGYGLTLARLLEALHDLGISPVGEAGAPFDPHTMTAVGTIECDDPPAGTVVEVYAPGFLRHGEVLREAKVVVATAPAPAVAERPSESHRRAQPASQVEPKPGAPSPHETMEHAS